MGEHSRWQYVSTEICPPFVSNVQAPRKPAEKLARYVIYRRERDADQLSREHLGSNGPHVAAAIDDQRRHSHAVGGAAEAVPNSLAEPPAKHCWRPSRKTATRDTKPTEGRDLAIILTALLAGLRVDELRQADVGDIPTTDEGAAAIPVRWQRPPGTQRAHQGRTLSVIERYLDRRARGRTHHSRNAAIPDQSRVQASQPGCPAPTGCPDHGLRHTYAT